VRKAARTAAQMNAEWYAVHVETPDESVQKISTSNFRALLDNVNLAAELGGEVVWLKATDVIKTLTDFARAKQITRIIVGRTHPTLWSRILGRSMTNRLLASAAEFDIEVIGRDTKS
jgi:two-component system sensor histidine kinase KdpD